MLLDNMTRRNFCILWYKTMFYNDMLRAYLLSYNFMLNNNLC